MRWTAIVPVKALPMRKSRLTTHLSAADRADLSRTMLDHVVGRLVACRSVASVLILSPDPIGAVDMVLDEGRGLNDELAHARFAAGTGPVLVIHADLPLLTVCDLDLLLAAATANGQAIAPDRHGTGTNAVAIADDTPIAWQFGVSSFARHKAVLAPNCVVVERPGLLDDCDTYADLLHAQAGGFVWARERYAAEPLTWGESA